MKKRNVVLRLLIGLLLPSIVIVTQIGTILTFFAGALMGSSGAVNASLGGVFFILGGSIAIFINWYYWMYTMLVDTAYLLDEEGHPIRDVLISMVTCNIYGVYLSYKIGEDLFRIGQKTEDMSSNISVTCMVLSIFGLGIVSMAMIQSGLNRYVPDEII